MKKSVLLAGACLISGLVAGAADPIPELPCRWERLNLDGGGYIGRIVVDPSRPERVYCLSDKGGIHRSDDGGKTWTMKNHGFTRETHYGVSDLIINPKNPNRLVAAVGNAAWAWKFWYPGSVMVSDDGGDNWKKVFQDKAFGYLTRMASDPVNPDVLYLSAFSTRPFYDSDGGVKKSVDGGKSWETVFPGKACWGVYVHPRNPEIVFAATYDSGLFRSTDGGESWLRLEDYPAPSPISVTFDPDDPDTVYVCNYGASVYRGTLK